MKRYIWPVLFLSLVLISSCSEPTAELEVTAAFPQGTVQDCSYYDCRVRQDGRTIEAGSRDGTFHFTGLANCLTDIHISACSDSCDAAWSCKTSRLLSAGLNEVRLCLQLEPRNSKGITISFPLANEAYVTLMEEKLGRVVFQSKKIEKDSIDIPSLPYGHYLITLQHGVDGNQVSDEFRFTCSADTPDELIFMGSHDSISGEDSIRTGLEDMSAGPITGYISITCMGQCMELELIPTDLDEGIGKGALIVEWYRNGIRIGTGFSLKVKREAGTYRYDCIIRSRLLGSYGSESVMISIS